MEVDLRKNPPKIKLPQGKTENAGFAYIVPDLKFNNVRIELDNNFPNKGNDISWRVSIHHATGKTSMKSAFPSLKQIKELIRKIENQDKVEKFEKDLEKIFTSKIPSAQKFQKQYIMVNPDKNYFTPFETLEKLSKLTLKHFPMKEFKESYVSNLKKDDIEIISFDKGKIPGNKISIIQIIALYGLKKILLI